MRKYPNPITTYFMGIFMMISAIIYTVVINECFNMEDFDTLLRMIFGMPVLFLTVGGCVTCIYSLKLRDKLIYSAIHDAWIIK